VNEAVSSGNACISSRREDFDVSHVPTLRPGWPVLALAATVLFALPLWLRAPANAQAPAPRWEYAELSFDGTASVAGEAKASVTWEDSQRSTSASDFRSLARKLGWSLRRDDSTSILNAAGAQGWEVTSQSATSWTMSPTSSTGAVGQTQYWTLKRPK
jgi:hypothetical protein